MKKSFLIILTILLVVSFSGMTECLSAEEEQATNIPLPTIGDRFTYHARVTGDSEATTEEPNEHEEYHEFRGIKEGVKGQTKEGIIDEAVPYDSAWWKITRSDNSDYVDLYQAIIGNTLCWYLEVNSNTDITEYVTPMTFFGFPLEEGKVYSSESVTYLWVHETGSGIVSTYKTKGSYPEYKDSTTIDVTVSKEEITVLAGTFECYKVHTIFTVKSGSGVTKSTTINDLINWYSPELKTWVKEESKIDVSAAFWQKFSGTRIRELVDYEVKEVKI